MAKRKIIPLNTCEQCGTQFRARPDRAHKVRFCGWACFREAKQAEGRIKVDRCASKKCPKCGTIKPASDFRIVRHRGRTYLNSYCTPCDNAKQRDYKLARGLTKTIPRYSLRPFVDTDGVTKKLCSRCGFIKARPEFGTRLGRVASCCKPCIRAAEPKSSERFRDPVKRRIQQKRHYYANKDKYLAMCHRYYHSLSQEEKRARLVRHRDVSYRSRSTRRARLKRVRREPISRKAVIERDNSTCYLCGQLVPESQIHLDHVVPLKRGGSHTYDNLRVACQTCNLRKKDLLLSDLDWAKPNLALFQL